jgi:hypothetical protein
LANFGVAGSEFRSLYLSVQLASILTRAPACRQAGKNSLNFESPKIPGSLFSARIASKNESPRLGCWVSEQSP